VAGGIDSVLRVFPLSHNDTFRLSFFGSSTIFDFVFLPDGMLVVLYKLGDSYEEQKPELIVYNRKAQRLKKYSQSELRL